MSEAREEKMLCSGDTDTKETRRKEEKSQARIAYFLGSLPPWQFPILITTLNIVPSAPKMHTL